MPFPSTSSLLARLLPRGSEEMIFHGRVLLDPFAHVAANMGGGYAQIKVEFGHRGDALPIRISISAVSQGWKRRASAAAGDAFGVGIGADGLKLRRAPGQPEKPRGSPISGVKSIRISGSPSADKADQRAKTTSRPAHSPVCASVCHH